MMNVGTGGAPAAAWALGSGKLPGGGDVLSILHVLWSGYPPRPPLPRPLPLPRILESLWWLPVVAGAAAIHMCLSHYSLRTTSRHLLSASAWVKHAGVIAEQPLKTVSGGPADRKVDQYYMGQANQGIQEHESCDNHHLLTVCMLAAARTAWQQDASLAENSLRILPTSPMHIELPDMSSTYLWGGLLRWGHPSHPALPDWHWAPDPKCQVMHPSETPGLLCPLRAQSCFCCCPCQD